MNFDFADLLMDVVARRASDLHITAGAPPMVRVRGRLVGVEGYPRLSPTDTREVVYSILTNDQRQKLETECQIDFAYSVPGHARFRVNAYFQRSAIGAAFRLIPADIISIDDLGLPTAVHDFTKKPRGLVLVTGPTGSGKSTTLAAMLDSINAERQEHILTIEDPIEFLHKHKKCIVNQRELGADAATFALGLKAALRQDPDVILVGEMRDIETVKTALTAAETGHLVFSTLHTISATDSINRIIDFFPSHQQAQARAMIAGTLKGIVSQRLVPTVDGNGRIATAEILVMTGRVHDMIMDPTLTGQLPEVIAEGGYYGMQTFDQHLMQHLQAGRVGMEDALRVATSPHDFKLMVHAAGRPKGEGQAQGPGAPARDTRREPTVYPLPGVATVTESAPPPPAAAPPAPQPSSAPQPSAAPPGFGG